MIGLAEDDREQLRALVWKGTATHAEARAALDEMCADGGLDGEAPTLTAAFEAEWAAKAAAEPGWPAVTDCDRLDAAFDDLRAQGSIALHDAGFDMSEGLAAVDAAWAQDGKHVLAYCFYHGQDIERAIGTGVLMLAFGAFDNDPQTKAAAGRTVMAALRRAGLLAAWQGDPERRITLQPFAWQRRAPV